MNGRDLWLVFFLDLFCNHSFPMCHLTSLCVSVRVEHCNKSYSNSHKPFTYRRLQAPRFYNGFRAWGRRSRT